MNRKVAGWAIALCGLWEAGDIAALFVPGFGQIPAFLWNHILVGAFLIVAGVWAARARDVHTAKTLLWLTAAAGAWLLIASFILGNPMTAPGIWNDVIIAVIVLILGVWAVLATSREAK